MNKILHIDDDFNHRDMYQMLHEIAMRTLITEEDKSNSYNKKGDDLAEFSVIATEVKKGYIILQKKQQKKQQECAKVESDLEQYFQSLSAQN